jgi:hypothetical protein
MDNEKISAENFGNQLYTALKNGETIPIKAQLFANCLYGKRGVNKEAAITAFTYYGELCEGLPCETPTNSIDFATDDVRAELYKLVGREVPPRTKIATESEKPLGVEEAAKVVGGDTLKVTEIKTTEQVPLAPVADKVQPPASEAASIIIAKDQDPDGWRVKGHAAGESDVEKNDLSGDIQGRNSTKSDTNPNAPYKGINRFALTPETEKTQGMSGDLYSLPSTGDAEELGTPKAEPDGTRAREDIKKRGPGDDGEVYTAS